MAGASGAARVWRMLAREDDVEAAGAGPASRESGSEDEPGPSSSSRTSGGLRLAALVLLATLVCIGLAHILSPAFATKSSFGHHHASGAQGLDERQWMKRKQEIQKLGETWTEDEEADDKEDDHVVDEPKKDEKTAKSKKLKRKKAKKAASAGWYDGGADQSCDTGCEALGLVCTEEALHEHNGGVVDSARVLQLITNSGGVTAAGGCSGEFGMSTDAPLWNDGVCFSSQLLRPFASFDCGRAPSPLGEGKHRLCYCHEQRVHVAGAANRTGAKEHRRRHKEVRREPPAAQEACSLEGEDCSQSRCCHEPGHVCFEKVKGWATCLLDCTPGVHEHDPPEYQEPWSCKALAQAAQPALPTMYCFVAMQSEGPEFELVKHQFLARVGIFSCEGFAVFSNAVVSLDASVETRMLQRFAASSQVQGALTATWVNTAAFIEAWEAVMKEKDSWDHDWLVKVDPDTVFFPVQLKIRLQQLDPEVQRRDKGSGAYLRNCNTANLQLYGSIEVVSHKALGQFKNRGGRCDSPENARMGEDMWIQRCLDTLGVAGVADYEFLRDGYCPTDAHRPCAFGAAAYHPYKAVEQWSDCWGAARLPPAAPKANVSSKKAGKLVKFKQ